MSNILKATIQAAVLSALSNTLAQFITCYRSGTPFSLQLIRLLQFVTFSILSCPPNCIWQAWLEAQFPGYAEELEPSEKKEVMDEAVKGRASGVEKEETNASTTKRHTNEKAMTEKSRATASKKSTGSLSIKNTAIKFTLDQTVGAAINTVLFIAGIGLLQGNALEGILHEVQQGFWPMIFAGQKLWPAVSILSFTVIPLEHRMLFGSAAGLFWGVYLSLAAGSAKA